MLGWDVGGLLDEHNTGQDKVSEGDSERWLAFCHIVSAPDKGGDEVGTDSEKRLKGPGALCEAGE